MFLKGHYKSDKPDGVIPREEAEVRHYAMETSISGGIVATSDPTFLSLSTRPTHGVVVRACDTRENKSARRKSVSRRGWNVADASPTRFDGDSFRMRTPTEFIPTHTRLRL